MTCGTLDTRQMLLRTTPIPIALFLLKMYLNVLYFSSVFALTLKTMACSNIFFLIQYFSIKHEVEHY